MAASNSIWYPTQYSFAGGEVSPRIQVRQDIGAYPQSVLQMVNMFPTLQGSTQRIPGFSFLAEVATGNNEDARIIGFRDAIDKPTLAIYTGGKVTIQVGFGNASAARDGVPTPYAITGTKQNIVQNYDFSLGGRYWNTSYFTLEGWGPEDGLPLISFVTEENNNYCEFQQSFNYSTLGEDFQTDNQMYIEQWLNVPIATDISTLRFTGTYTAIASRSGAYDITQDAIDKMHPRIRYQIFDLEDAGALVFEHVEDIQPVQIGQDISFNRALGYGLPGTDYVGVLLLRVELYFEYTPPATAPGAPAYRLSFKLNQITVETEDVGLPDSVELVTPYFNDDLAAIQYVQSPYEPYELITVHPLYPPQKLYWDVGGSEFLFAPLIADPVNHPAGWGEGHYPASCTAYQGRLILGGYGLTAQTVWGSESGVWDNFTIPTTPTGKDPLEFTSTFRSAIKWMAGHKQLLVGTTEVEYTVTSDSGVLVSGDIDVRVNSSHGSVNCQPAPYGDELMFASERGSRIRAAARDFGRVGWGCKDMNMLAPHITAQGIVRIVRLRNPHPMLLCVLKNGTLAVLHYDRDLEFHGWSRIGVSGNIVDITVLTNADGIDVPYIVVQRSIQGEFKIYVEGMPAFTENNSGAIYMDSNVFQSNLTSATITGLDHLNGKIVQVVTEHGYAGSWVVLAGQITLQDNNGNDIEFTQAAVGMPQTCALATLAPVVNQQSGGFLAKLRYSDVMVRVRNSTAPLMLMGDSWNNIVRPPDRSPDTAMDTVAVLSGITDVKVSNLGWDEKQTVVLLEDTPNRVEILAMSYKLASKVL